MRLLLFRPAVFRGGLMAQVLGFFPDVCQLFHGLLLDEHGLGKALDGQFPGNGTFYYFPMAAAIIPPTKPQRPLLFM